MSGRKRVHDHLRIEVNRFNESPNLPSINSKKLANKTPQKSSKSKAYNIFDITPSVLIKASL